MPEWRKNNNYLILMMSAKLSAIKLERRHPRLLQENGK